MTRPIKELKGFQRVELQPGETFRVRFNLRAEDLAGHRAGTLPRLDWPKQRGGFAGRV